ncbi:MAG TPA: hypothetical protein VFA18_05090 [Gemmataceae bacterium]|nr:hypothetical protein [Gemmataceae bacterium]
MKSLPVGWFDGKNGRGVCAHPSRLRSTIGIAVGLVALVFGPPRCVADVSAHAKALHSAFRQAYPFHLQTIAVSPPAAGMQVLIISEPPPHVRLRDLRQLDAEVFKRVEIRSHGVGVGGFVKDVVAEFPTSRIGQARFNRLLAGLGMRLFRTSYKLPVIHLERLPGLARTNTNLNLTVSAAELREWLLGDKQPLALYPIGGQRTITACDIFKTSPKISFVANTATSGAGANGSRGSVRAGLVTWWVPTGKDLSAWQIEARQFTIDSDVLIGALIDPLEGVLFVGRARQAPMDEIPPLRFETLLLLSRIQRASLAQSYERQDPLAYPFSDGHDWAPAYLSDQLVDTELGSLLDIADQLLKRWSNNGEVTYEGFRFPDPKAWEFSQPLGIIALERTQASSLTFNWNTAGIAYLVAGKSPQIFALTRTGALPTSYIPERAESIPNEGAAQSAMRAYEDRGHTFFAKQSDPNLFRVAQYTAFYQIFQQAGFYRHRSEPPPRKDYPERIKRELVRSYVQEVRKTKANELKARVIQLIDAEIAWVRAKKLPAQKERSQTLSISISKFFVQGLVDEARLAAIAATDAELSLAADYLADARAEHIRLTPAGIKLARTLAPIVQAVALSHSFHNDWNKRATDKAQQAEVWLHTPVIVVSRAAKTMASFSGGHNVDAVVTAVQIQRDNSLSANQIRVERRAGGEVILRISDPARDIPNEVFRLIGRGMIDERRLDRAFRNGSAVVRTPDEALGTVARALETASGSDGAGNRGGGIGGGNGRGGLGKGGGSGGGRDGNGDGPSGNAGGYGGGRGGGRLPPTGGWWEFDPAWFSGDGPSHPRRQRPGAKTTVYATRDKETGVITLIRTDPSGGKRGSAFRAASALDAADVISAWIKADLVYTDIDSKEAEPSAPVYLICEEGFTREEAAGLAQTARLRLNQHFDSRVVSQLRAEWFPKPADRQRLDQVLAAPVDVQAIQVTEPAPVQRIAGALVTSFEFRSNVSVGGKKLACTGEVRVEAGGNPARGKLRDYASSLVKRVRQWFGARRGQYTLGDVLHDLKQELEAVEARGLEKGGGVSLKLTNLKAEAASFGIVLHLRVRERANSAT